MHRFLITPENVHGSTIHIADPCELHHIRHVLRLGIGQRVTCLDGQGRGYVGVIDRVAPDRLDVRIERQLDRPIGAAPLWLVQALVKGERFEWLLQKATELGAARIAPVSTRHAVVRIAQAQRTPKLERWRRIAQEAAKQCGALSVPTIDPVQPLERVLESLGDAAWVLMPTLAVTAIPLRQVVEQLQREAPPAAGRPVAILIGPEGDFDADEVALAERFGARPVSLGPLTLRSETAAVASLAMLQYALGA
jgi:16S rRNA (uracil1498-N3)-methyltransferase